MEEVVFVCLEDDEEETVDLEVISDCLEKDDDFESALVVEVSDCLEAEEERREDPPDEDRLACLEPEEDRIDDLLTSDCLEADEDLTDALEVAEGADDDLIALLAAEAIPVCRTAEDERRGGAEGRVDLEARVEAM